MWGLGPISVQNSYRSIHKISSNLNCLVGKFVLSAKILTLWLPFDVLWGRSTDLLNQLAYLIYTVLGNERWQNWYLISHFTIHSPYFIVLNQCSIVSHLLWALPSLPLHCGASMFTQALLHILTWVSYCSLEDSIWCSWFSQQSVSVVVCSKTITESSNLNFLGLIYVKSSPIVLLFVPLLSANKMLPFSHSFSIQETSMPGFSTKLCGDPSFEILGECMKTCCIVKVISTQSSAAFYGDG